MTESSDRAEAEVPVVRKTFWAWTVATFCGAGFFKSGPGTAGSLAAVLLWLLAGRFTWSVPKSVGFVSNGELAWITAAAALLLLALAIPAATIVAREIGRKDPQVVVADEVVGQWITLVAAFYPSWKYAVAGFLLFRLFDIWKPQPIRWIEDLPGGWGIMLDDVGAGLYAFVCLRFIHHAFDSSRMWLR